VRVEDRAYPGVYSNDAGGTEQLVHLYQGGTYKLADICEIFELGKVEGIERDETSALVLDRRELRRLKASADAFSFDYEEPFIEMCYEMVRFAAGVPGDSVRFEANFNGDWRETAD